MARDGSGSKRGKQRSVIEEPPESLGRTRLALEEPADPVAVWAAPSNLVQELLSVGSYWEDLVIEPMFDHRIDEVESEPKFVALVPLGEELVWP